MEKGRHVPAVIRNRRFQWHSRIREKRCTAAHTISHGCDVIAGLRIALQPVVRGFDVAFEACFLYCLHMRHGTREVRVVSFPFRWHRSVKNLRRDREKTETGEAIGNVANVSVYTEEFRDGGLAAGAAKEGSHG